LSVQADPPRTTRKPPVLDIGTENIVQIRGRGPFQNAVAGRKQQAPREPVSWASSSRTPSQSSGTKEHS
jgi:hypothetical protein